MRPYCSESEKLNDFKLVISPSEENGSLKIFQQVWVWGSVFVKDFEKSFTVQHGEKLWLHVANGEIEVEGQILKKGDALKVENQTALKVKGKAPKSEFIMIELN